jgi:hypothetical protein
MDGRKKRYKINWDKVQSDYCEGILTLAQIGKKHGVAAPTISTRAKYLGWRGAKRAINRAIPSRIKAVRVIEVVPLSEKRQQEIVEERSAAIIEVLEGHRRLIGQGRRVCRALMTELNDRLGEQRLAISESGKSIGLSLSAIDAFSQTAKTLAQAMRLFIPLERQCFGLDTNPIDPTTDNPKQLTEEIVRDLDEQIRGLKKTGSAPTKDS